MARGDTYLADIPGGIGPHLSMVLLERTGFVTVIYGQTDEYPGAHTVKLTDPVAQEFRPHLIYATHFHKNNLALLPVTSLPTARLGHVDDQDLPPFVKAAHKGFLALGQIGAALLASGHRCECEGGCKKHEPPCTAVQDPAIGYSVMDWRVTVKNRVVCRSCWEW